MFEQARQIQRALALAGDLSAAAEVLRSSEAESLLREPETGDADVVEMELNDAGEASGPAKPHLEEPGASVDSEPGEFSTSTHGPTLLEQNESELNENDQVKTIDSLDGPELNGGPSRGIQRRVKRQRSEQESPASATESPSNELMMDTSDGAIR